jgi:carbamoyltransferase
MKVLGISCFYHDSGVAFIEDGELKYAIHEERVSREKQDSRFPIMGINRGLAACGWKISDIDQIAFYEKPFLKFERLIKQVIADWPRSWDMFRYHLPQFIQYKMPIEKIVRETLGYKGNITFIDHHHSHAAAGFFTSPFDKAIVLTVDGVGEYDTTAVFIGEGNSLKKVSAIHFPDSLGLFYSVFTQYLGFQVNEGEYKVMGLAPYGEPKYVDHILNKVIHLQDDGSYYLDQKYFDFSNKNKHFRDNLIRLMPTKPRIKEDKVEQVHYDLAASVQKVLELALENMIEALIKKYGIKNFCMGGGVALNCTANAELIRKFGINLYIQPAAGDAGGALGAALNAHVTSLNGSGDSYKCDFTPFLGDGFSEGEIATTLELNGIPFKKLENPAEHIAKILDDGKVVALFQGREEWGPRALGNRSILTKTFPGEMKDHLNAKIKFREQFRPFAPICMAEHYGEYFETLDMKDSPYMLFTHLVQKPNKIPATVHVNNTGRVQTVSRDQNPYMHRILDEFRKVNGTPVLINTSFNLRGEPIVSTPSDAIKTFLASGIDYLLMEDVLVSKEDIDM